jgi:hypothetical protein
MSEGKILTVGKMQIEQLGETIRIVIPCPTVEEADLIFSAIAKAWEGTGGLWLAKRERSP